MLNGATCLAIEWRADSVVFGWVSGRARLRLRDFEIVPLDTREAVGRDAWREVVDSLRGLLKRQRGGMPDKVVLGVPRHEAVVQYVEVPEAAAENLDQVMRFELERHLPFPSDEVYADHCLVRRNDGNLVNLAVAVRKGRLDELLTVLQEAGLAASLVELAPIGLLAFWRHEARSDEPLVLVNVEQQRADISIALQDQLLTTHEVRLHAGDPWPAIERELERVLLVAQSTLGVPRVEHAALHGARSLCERLLPHLEQRFAGKLRSGMGSVRIDEQLRRRPDYDAGLLQTALGLAARLYYVKSPGCNLLPADRLQQAGRGGVYVSAVLLALILLFGGVYGASWAIQQRRTLTELNGRVESLRREVFAVRDLERDLNARVAELRQFERLKDSGVGTLNLLRELTSTIPSTAYLERLRFKNGRVELSGLAEAASNLIPTLEAAELFTNVEFTAPITSRGTLERFQLRLDVER